METTLSVMKSMRHVDPKRYDRVAALVLKHGNTDAHNIMYVDQFARACVISNNTKKYMQLLQKLEHKVIDGASYNFIIENIPAYAVEQASQQQVVVGYANLKETLEQFGGLDKFELVYGTVYAKFSDKETCHTVHSRINNMMIGDNVICTRIV